MRPCARGPGASAMGGAGVGDGEREGGSVALGIMLYECGGMHDGTKSEVAKYLFVVKVGCARMSRVFTFVKALHRLRSSRISLTTRSATHHCEANKRPNR